MLILSRKAEQTIQIGEQIRVTILSIRGTRVTIGLEAPDSVQILRGELERSGSHLEVSPEERTLSKAARGWRHSLENAWRVRSSCPLTNDARH